MSGDRRERYRALVEREQLFTGSPPTTVDAAQDLALKSLVEVVTQQSRIGGGILRKDAFALGQALEWSKLDFASRLDEMRRACAAALRRHGPTRVEHEPDDVTVPLVLGGERVLCCVHAIPAAASVAAAREMVGKPHLRDHLHYDEEGRAAGPVHIVACFKGATEKQATDLLGFPDATVVTTTFGIYLADDVQKVQLILLSNCRDATSTEFGVQRFFDWLKRSGEDSALLARAKSRRRIVAAVRNERG